jgi:hypothetical protein
LDAVGVDGNGDGVVDTNNPMPLFAGTAEAGSVVSVSFDPDPSVSSNEVVLCDATADSEGVWGCASQTPLPEGLDHLVVIATDRAGNVSDPLAVPVNIDMTRPVDPVVNGSNGSLISGQMPASEAGSAVNIVTDNAQVVPGCESVRVGSDGTFSCTPNPVLPSGSVISVSVLDAAGNRSNAVSITITPVVVPVPGLDSLGSDNDGDGALDLATDRPNFAGSGEPGLTVDVSYSNGTVLSLCSGVPVQADGRWSCQAGVGLPQGLGTITVTASDGHGNVSEPVRVPVHVDSVAPVVPEVDRSNGAVISGRTGGF